MMKRLGVLVYVVMASAALARAEEGKAAALASLQGMAGTTAAAESIKSLPGVTVGEAAAIMPTVYTGNSRHIGLRGFSSLERLGVQGEAENRALANCQAAGLLNCVVIGSQVTSCNRYKCEATATARELAVVPGVQLETVSAVFEEYPKDIEGYHNFSPLDEIGVVKSARDRAIFFCQNKGLLDCVIFASSLVACVDDHSCTATATARGRK